METFLNKNGKPMIRSCLKCAFFRPIEGTNLGYCVLQPTMFAYTMEETVFDIKHTYYLCEKHEFVDEEYLRENAKSVDLKTILRKKENIL